MVIDPAASAFTTFYRQQRLSASCSLLLGAQLCRICLSGQGCMIARPPQPGLKFSRSAALTAIQPQYQRPGCRHQQAVSILVAERLRTQSGKSSSQGPSREVREDVKETARHEGRQQKADSHGSRQSIENWRDLLDVRNWTARGRGLVCISLAAFA